jgi:hypothetical protein
MNQEAQELVKQYITETLKDEHGISIQVYSLMEMMMKVDRNLASQLHDIYSECIRVGNRYFIPTDDSVV